MPNANPQNNFLQEILNRLAAIDEKMDKGFKAAADDRQTIRHEVQQVSNSVQQVSNALEEFRKKTAENFANAGRELGEVGISLHEKAASRYQEFQKFQQQTQAFIQESRHFQSAMMNTVKDITRLLERIENKQIIIQETFAQLKEENAKLKQEKAAQDVIIKKLEQRVATLEALQS